MDSSFNVEDIKELRFIAHNYNALLIKQNDW
ncbi:hypothetical protein THF1A12_320127 [Vibrio jasicida]|uniref:Uncharacterized protein n=1 Tax=Vibrio jasicida TaxID=766224 RepID=A0AAU9QPG5_9VIBR|nr:hypothetical protein THF1A12_320127 [Vibrio jasicida]